MATGVGHAHRPCNPPRLPPNEPAPITRTWQELKAVLSARIEEGLAGKVSAKSVGDILDEELAKGRRV
ncbi:hypothetical protein [Xanthomonas bonasiae]|uniref:hypothetical protein n=1 Tax=Xanthomonas bonasiae TaxID=2810351 RepID=UPI003CCD8ADF